MSIISPVRIDQVPSGRTGRPKQERIAELENLVNLAVISGRASVMVDLTEDEDRNHTLFRSRARAAGQRSGRHVRASVVDGRGHMVISVEPTEDEDE